MWSQQEQRAKYAPHGMHREMEKLLGFCTFHHRGQEVCGLAGPQVTKKAAAPPTAGVAQTVHSRERE